MDYRNLMERETESETIFEGKIIRLRVAKNELPDGRIATREIIDHPGGVGILPLDSNGNVYLVRQFRAPFGKVLLEIPAGKLEYGEDPLSCGIRELKEEVGAKAKTMTSLGLSYSTPGFCNEIIYLYLATDLSFGETAFDDGEFLSTEKIPLSALVDMVMKNEIDDAKTQLAILRTDALIRAGKITF